MSALSMALSIISLFISASTLWLTFLRHGKLRMTQPTIIYLGPDGAGSTGAPPKVTLRTLLYSTARRGQVLESLHVSLRRGESRQNFNIWVYGDPGKLVRGSGLHIGPEGFATYHHFLLPPDGANFHFLAGSYTLVIMAKEIRDREAREIAKFELNISEQQAADCAEKRSGVMFDWGPDRRNYHGHLIGKPAQLPRELASNNETPAVERAASSKASVDSSGLAIPTAYPGKP